MRENTQHTKEINWFPEVAELLYLTPEINT